MQLKSWKPFSALCFLLHVDLTVTLQGSFKNVSLPMTGKSRLLAGKYLLTLNKYCFFSGSVSDFMVYL